MDQLELLKKNWSKDSDNYQKLSSSEISPMLVKKSSSIVRTLFYISIGELVFWTLLNFLPIFMSTEYNDKINSMFGEHLMFNVITVLNMVFIIIFSLLLYSSYRSISVKDNIKNFMASIIRTRKVIKYFVLCNLGLLFVSFIVAFYYAINDIPELAAMIDTADSSKMSLILLKFVALIATVIGVFWLIYKLIYGILISRLNKNYTELEKLEN